MKKLMIFLAVLVFVSCEKESLENYQSPNDAHEITTSFKADKDKKGWFGRLMDKIKGLLPKIEIKFGTNTVVFDSEGNPKIIPCVFSGICHVLAGSTNSANGNSTDATGYLVMHEGDLVIAFDKSSIDPLEYNNHFSNGTIQVGDDILFDNSTCATLNIPSGSSISAGSYFIEYEDEDYIAVKF